MRFSSFSGRIGGDGAGAWVQHFQALEALKAGDDVIIMSVGDSDYDTPVEIVDVCISALRAGDTHYTPVPGQNKFRNAVACRHRKRTGVDCRTENVIICAGTQNALFNTAMIALSPGDEVIVLEPMYVTYEATFKATGATIVPVECPPTNNYRPNIEAIEAAISEKTTAIAFATPVNPTGAVFLQSDLKAIAQIARQHDLWVIADEVYGDLVFDGQHISIASLPAMAERTITLGSLSKSHAMPGWRAGWAIAPEAFAREMEKLVLCSTYGLPGFIQQAATFAIEAEIAGVTDIYNGILRRRDLACAMLENSPFLKFEPPRAGMFLIIDVSRSGITSMEFAFRLYQEERVSVLDGGVFGPSTKNTIRVCFAMSEEQLREGCKRITRFTDRLAAGVHQ